MFKLDNAFLEELGLGTLPPIEKNKMLAHIYETLEMKVGMKLAEQMTNEQLDEFESYINRKDEAGALKWLEGNFPNYKDVVAAELEKLKGEIRQVAPQIVAQSQQNAAAAVLQKPTATASQLTQQHITTPATDQPQTIQQPPIQQTPAFPQSSTGPQISAAPGAKHAQSENIGPITDKPQQLPQVPQPVAMPQQQPTIAPATPQPQFATPQHQMGMGVPPTPTPTPTPTTTQPAPRPQNIPPAPQSNKQ